MSDGVALDIFVLHTGDTDYNTSGLTTDRDSGCNTDGTATKSGNTAIVR